MSGSAEARSWFSSLTLQAKVTLIVVPALLAGVGGYWGYTERYTCGSGLAVIDGQCIGVTDGSYLFDPAFTEVQKKITDENAWVRTQPSYVTVALLNPMTGSGEFTTEDIRNLLEGAYTAQYRVNHTSAVSDDPSPPIQLLLANEGSNQHQWEPVVDQLVTMTQGDHPLVAVAGMGSSFIETKLAAEKLAEHRIPMVGAFFNADELEYSKIRGLIRVTPSVHDYVRALDGYLDSHPLLDSAILVYDSNAELKVDLFADALRRNLNQELGHLMKFPALSFQGGSLENTKPKLVNDITPNICAAATQGLNVVLYAGRRGDFNSFLDALELRICRNLPLTIMTGTDPRAQLSGREQQLRDAKLTVVFPGRTDVSGWNQNIPGTPEHYPSFVREFTNIGFDPKHLGSRSITMHDAILTAVKAVRLATPGGSAPATPTAQDVFSQLLNLNGLNTVPGAGGALNFSYSEQGAGNPKGKQVMVFQVPPLTDGPSQQVGPDYFTPYGP